MASRHRHTDSWVESRLDLLERLQRTIERSRRNPELQESEVMREAERRASELYALLELEGDQRSFMQGSRTLHIWPPPADEVDAAQDALLDLARSSPLRREHSMSGRSGSFHDGDNPGARLHPMHEPTPRGMRESTSWSDGAVPHEGYFRGSVERYSWQPVTHDRRPRRGTRAASTPSWQVGDEPARAEGASSSTSLELSLAGLTSAGLGRRRNEWRRVALTFGAVLLGVVVGAALVTTDGEDTALRPARHAAAQPDETLEAPKDGVDLHPLLPARADEGADAPAAPVMAPGTTTRETESAPTDSALEKRRRKSLTRASTATAPTEPRPRAGRLPGKKGEKLPPPKGFVPPASDAVRAADCKDSSDPLCGIPL